MAAIAGKVAKICIGGYIKAKTIAFVNSNPDTITDSGNGFVLGGFVTGDKIVVTGSASNNGTFTIETVVAGTITLIIGDSLTPEAAGAEVTIRRADPGNVVYGFKDWSLDYGANIEDVTTFESSGKKEFIACNTGWTIKANGYWDASGTGEENFVGRERYFHIFTKYVAVPSGGDPAYYYHGAGILQGVGFDEDVGRVVTKAVSIQGQGALSALTTKTSAW